jgi:CBS domain-containing protein
MLKSVKVRDYMTTSLVVFRPQTELFHAIDQLLRSKISGAPVVDDEGHLVGVLSEVDCLKGILSGSYYDYESLGGTVSECMSTLVETVAVEDDILQVSERFIRNGRRRFPVVDNGKLVGQISRRDVLRAVKDFVSPEALHKSAN